MKTKNQIEAELIELHEERMRLYSMRADRTEIMEQIRAKRSELSNAPEEKRRPSPRSPIEMLLSMLAIG